MKGRKIKHSDSLRPSVQSIFISNRQVAFDPSPKSISGHSSRRKSFDQERLRL